MIKRIFILIAVVLTVAGIALFAGALIASGFDISKLGTDKYETNTYTVQEEFDKIEISTKETDVIFKPSEDGQFSAVCVERKNAKHTLTVSDGTLKISVTDTRKWYEHISLFSKSLTMTVYLPQQSYESLTVDSSTGDVSIPDNFTFGSIMLTESTGDAECFASVERNLSIKTTTGDIRVSGVSAQNISLSVSTGKIKLENSSCTGKVTVNVSVGKTTVSGLTCESLESEGSTGDLTLKNATASGSMDLKRSTGDITFENCDAGQISVKTSTGNIEGTLLTEKIFTAKTSTGKVDVPSTANGGKCELTTTTGKIYIKLSGN